MKKNVLKASFVIFNLMILLFIFSIFAWDRRTNSIVYGANFFGNFIVGFREVTGYTELFSISFPVAWKHTVLLTYYFLIAWIVLIGIVNYCLWKLLMNLSKAKVFTIANARLFKILGLTVLAFTFTFKLFDVGKMWYTSSFSTEHLIGGLVAMIFNHYFVIGLTIFGIGEIFEYGVKIKQENDLTV